MSDQQPPDAISSEQLQQLLGEANRGPSDHLVGTAVPTLPLFADDAGIGDLVLGVEQLIAAAGGATMLQMLHASCYLMTMTRAALISRLTDKTVDWNEFPFVYLHTQALVRSLSQCIASVEEFADPLTEYHAKNLGARLDSPRKGVVSDNALKALGLDIASYDAQLRPDASN